VDQYVMVRLKPPGTYSDAGGVRAAGVILESLEYVTLLLFGALHQPHDGIRRAVGLDLSSTPVIGAIRWYESSKRRRGCAEGPPPIALDFRSPRKAATLTVTTALTVTS
jgi:hypothetical protein